MVAPLFNPAPETVAKTNIEQFRQLTGASDFDALYQWSITQRESFWSTLWDYTGVIGAKGTTVATSPNAMPGTRWFPEARLNYAENLLRNPTNDAAIVATDERGRLETITRAELTRRAARFATHLTDCGIQPGDRVAGVVSNSIDTIAAMLGTTWIGAVWSSCSPDFGTQAIIDRFSQIEPRVLVGCFGYGYNGKWFDTTEKLASVKASLPNIEYSIALSNDTMQGWCLIDEIDQGPCTIPDFVRLPFDAPLYIMFSSGTTGVPKCIVHGIGGSLLQHMKEHQLHSDVSAGDRLFFFTTCGWMMWNWLASGLASQAVLCLYDGSPFHPDPGSLSRFVEAAQINHFGISPGYISALAKADYAPNEHHDLSSLTGILSTGSPLPAESFDWAYEHIAPVRLCSITGGTDIMGCFAARFRRRASAWPRTFLMTTAIQSRRAPQMAKVSWCAHGRFRRCQQASGTTRKALATAPPTSNGFPGSGTTAISANLPRKVASSSTAVPMRCSIVAAFASAPPRFTGRQKPWVRSWNQLPSVSNGRTTSELSCLSACAKTRHWMRNSASESEAPFAQAQVPGTYPMSSSRLRTSRERAAANW
jgi:acetoacetyl-CoA synthase